MNINPPFDEAGIAYQQTRKAHWDSVAKKRDHWRGMGRWYHHRLIEIYRYLVNPNQRILMELPFAVEPSDLIRREKPGAA